MSDFERYGDYNEVSESPTKSPVLLAIKITALVLCFSVVGLLLFRVFTLNYYPKAMKSVYFGEALNAYCADNGGTASAKTQEYGVELDPDDTSRFGFSLTKSGGDESATGAAAGIPMSATLSYCEYDSFMMYRYAKLVFDGVDFAGAEWIRLDITIDGVPHKTPYMIAIYENNEGFSEFIEYTLSSEVAK